MRSLYLLLFIVFFGASQVLAQRTEWASKLVDYSSEVAIGFFSSQQVLGKPNATPFGEENPNAWVPARPNRLDYVKVGFNRPFRARQIAVVENNNPGSVYRIFAYDRNDTEYLIASFEPKSVPLAGRVKNVFFPLTPYEVYAVKVVIDGGSVVGYNSIDAIAVSDSNLPVGPEVTLADNLLSNLSVQRLGDNVNSSSREAGPVLSPDGKTMFFSRQAHEGNMGGVYDAEDIWYSELDTTTGEWQKAINIGLPLNNDYPNFVSSVTSDGGSLLLILGNKYDEKGRKPKVGVSVSTKQGDTWSQPKPLAIDNDYNLSNNVDYFMGNSKKVLLMSYERNDSHGDRDIYVSFRRRDDTWTEPMNLGSQLNTLGEESAPFLANDEKTLYFTSTGLAGYGKRDIFVSTRLDDSWKKWSEPQNLGSDVNTTADESYFSIPSEGDYAYFTREVEEGNDDIFRVKLPLFYMPQPVVTLRGKVLNSKTGEPIAAKIYYERLRDGQEMGFTMSDPKTGEFSIVLPSGEQYGYRAEAEDMVAMSENIDLRKLEGNEKILQNLTLTPLVIGEKIVLNNIFFAFDKATLFDESKPELNYIANVLKENSEIRVEIGGHTDSVGADVYNQRLSQNRANTVAQYLINQGVDKSRFTIKGYGKSSPSHTNETPEGRAKNRRVEFKVIE